MGIQLDHGQDLLREHVEGVLRLARHLVRDPDEAEDVAQASLLAAVERRPNGVRNLRAWLRGVVRKKALQTHRAEGRRARHTRQMPPPGDAAATSTVAAGLEVQQQLVDAVAALPETYRTVVWFRYFEGVSAREIAARLDVPVETVRTRLKRAIGHLRADLDARHDGRRAAWTAALAPLLAPRSAAAALASPAALLGGLVLAFLVGVVVVVVLWQQQRTDATGTSAADPTIDAATRHEREVSPAELRGTTHGGTIAKSGPERERAPQGTQVHGRVMTQDGHPIAGARVAIVEGEGLVSLHAPPWRVLGRATAAAGGHYVVELDLDRRPTPGDPLPVLAVAEATGYWRGRQVVEIKGPRTTFDFHLGDGWQMEGYVVDVHGRPVADLPVLVATLDSPPHMVWGALLWTERKRLATVSGGYIEQRATTDEVGHFVVRGLEIGKRYGVLSEDLSWFLQQEELVHLDSDRAPPPFALVAVPARAVRGSVTDAATGEPVAKGIVELQLESPDGDSMGSHTSVRDGRFLAGWDLDDEQQGLLEVTVAASASGYRRARAGGQLSPDEPVLEVSLALEPILEEKGTVLLSVNGRLGAPLPGLVYVWVSRKDDADVRLQPRPERVRPGVFQFDLPAGTYTGTVRPRHVLGGRAEVGFDVVVRPHEVTTARVETSAGATLRLRLPLVDEMPRPSGMSISPIGERTHKIAGGSTDLTQQEAEILEGVDLVWAGFVAGTWRLKLTWGEERLERTVHLAEGDDQLVSFR